MRKQLSFLIGLQLLIIEIKSWNICTTPGCTAFAKMLKDSMNTTANPCDDFYEYTCGRWIEKNPIPTDELRWTISDILKKRTGERVKDILQSDSNSSSNKEALNKVKRMYESCMNSEAIEKDGAKIILSLLRKTGGWPIMKSSKNDHQQSTSLSSLLRYYAKTWNVEFLFNIYMDKQMNGSTENFLHIDGAFTTPLVATVEANSRDSSNIELYSSSIIKVVKILADEAGIEVDEENMKKDIDNLLDFEIALFQIMMNNSMRFERKGKVITVRNLQEFYNNHSRSTKSQIPWFRIIRRILNGTGIKFTKGDKIVLVGRKYMEKLIKLLEETSWRTVSNYIQWCFVRHLIPVASKKLSNISSQLELVKSYLAEVDQDGKKQSQHDRCLQEVLPHVLNHEYVKRYLPFNTTQIVNNTINEIINTHYHLFDQTLWLTPDERNFLQEKLLNITLSPIYPDWYDEPSALDNFYKPCDFSNNYMQNVLNLERCQRIIKLREIATRSNKNDFKTNTVASNAAWSPSSSAIVVSPGILQTPMFSTDYPPVLQYATLGHLIGHEISHAFDSFRIWFDRRGVGIEWGSSATKAIYTAKVDCFVKQYNNYEIYRMTNGTIYAKGAYTKNEDIPDLHGGKLTYRTYKNLKTSEDTKLRLPGLESFTDEQLFFLAYASIGCSLVRPEYYEYLVGKDVHSIRRLRITGVLSNMEEFSAAFNCPETAKMNPKSKCSIWGTAN